MKLTFITGIIAISVNLAIAGDLPTSIPENSPAAEVIKLTQANVGTDVITSYINNYAGSFSLTSDQVLALTDAGVPTAIIDLMLSHDKTAAAVAPNTGVITPPSEIISGPPAETAQTPTVATFQQELSPYGAWIYVEGYGQCWQPTVVRYSPDWQPYAVRGHWVYTDYGWFWQSDYAWGTTFHYGRWFLSSQGWCWWPDTVWAPSWVTWRNNGDYCGWAPLPPFTELRVGDGLYYRGSHVSLDFNFGFNVNCFTFVAVGHMGDRNPWQNRVRREDAGRIFNNTHYENHYEAHGQSFINHGFDVRNTPARGITPIRIDELKQSYRNHPVMTPSRQDFNRPNESHQTRNAPAINPGVEPRRNTEINRPVNPLITNPGSVPQRNTEFNRPNTEPNRSVNPPAVNPGAEPRNTEFNRPITNPGSVPRQEQHNYGQNQPQQFTPNNQVVNPGYNTGPRGNNTQSELSHQDKLGSPRALQNNPSDHSNKQDSNGKQ